MESGYSHTRTVGLLDQLDPFSSLNVVESVGLVGVEDFLGLFILSDLEAGFSIPRTWGRISPGFSHLLRLDFFSRVWVVFLSCPSDFSSPGIAPEHSRTQDGQTDNQKPENQTF
jgi:hypothetical protein